jgi:hypothetical protein
MLLAAGLAGGVVLGTLMILVRHGGPRNPDRGLPVVLFPRPTVPVRQLFGTSLLTSPG